MAKDFYRPLDLLFWHFHFPSPFPCQQSTFRTSPHTVVRSGNNFGEGGSPQQNTLIPLGRSWALLGAPGRIPMLIMGFSVRKGVMCVHVRVLYIDSEDIDMSDISSCGGFECTSDISSVSERGTDQAQSNLVSQSTSSIESRRVPPPFAVHML